jgi:hypothetical protein
MSNNEKWLVILNKKPYGWEMMGRRAWRWRPSRISRCVVSSIALRTEAVRTSETSVNYKIALRNLHNTGKFRTSLETGNKDRSCLHDAESYLRRGCCRRSLDDGFVRDLNSDVRVVNQRPRASHPARLVLIFECLQVWISEQPTMPKSVPALIRALSFWGGCVCGPRGRCAGRRYRDVPCRRGVRRE